MTNEEALAKWDAGEPVWTCEMGGMGPGYEQCIQLMVFEMLRAMVANPPDSWPALEGESGRDAWQAYRDAIEAIPSVKEIIQKLGPSGAQFGAAMSLASRFAMRGYEDAGIPEDRKIVVSKNFPTLTS
jgi:hypothetical protein